MTPEEWADVYGERAEEQGWSVFESDTRGLEIERTDEPAIFDSDEEALKYVTRLAERAEDRCAIEALRLIEEASTERGIRALTDLPEPTDSTPNGYDVRWVAAINTVLSEREESLRITDLTEECWERYIGPMVTEITERPGLLAVTEPVDVDVDVADVR